MEAKGGKEDEKGKKTKEGRRRMRGMRRREKRMGKWVSLKKYIIFVCLKPKPHFDQLYA